MEKIIAHLIAELSKKICERAFESDWNGLSVLAGQIREDCLETGRAVLEECLHAINLAFREDKARRKENGLVLQEKDRRREILTELGMIDISRDCYWDKNSGTYVYPLDELLEVERYERIDSGVRASLVWEACEESYQKSAEHVTGGAVSRQTVRNAILRCNDEAEIPAPEQKARVKELHIHADEDHVHMQKACKQKGKRNQTVPLVTVTEGSRAVSNSRNETVHPVHFVDKDFDTKALWTSVEGYLLKAYDMENVEAIYLHGDGGSWIRNGLRDYPVVISVMDGYHAERELKKADRMFPHRNVAWRVREALRKDDREKALAVVGSLSDSVCDTKAVDKLKEFTAYLENNWDALVRRYKGELPGSCTEGQVSHVLSERFSRNPMGWSPEGLGKLSKVRAYRINGGVKGRVIKSQPHNTTYAEYYRNYLSGKLNETLNWSIFENPVPVFDTNSGTQRLIRMIGHAG